MTVRGADRFKRKLARVKKEAPEELVKAHLRSGREVVRIAKVLIPEDTGESREDIVAWHVPEGVLIQFGPKAKVIEGNRGPRPFVNPALDVTRKRRKNAAKRAVSKVIRKHF